MHDLCAASNDCFIPKMIFTGRHTGWLVKGLQVPPPRPPAALLCLFFCLPPRARELASALVFFSKRNSARFTLKIHRGPGIMQLNVSTSEREKREGKNERKGGEVEEEGERQRGRRDAESGGGGGRWEIYCPRQRR